MRFADHHVLVTGGTSGIGLATATRLAGEGATLLLTGRSEDHMAEAKAALPDATIVANDASDPAAAATLASAVRAFAPDGLDGAFLNAGFGSFETLDAIDAAFIDKHFAVNVRGPLLQAQALRR